MTITYIDEKPKSNIQYLDADPNVPNPATEEADKGSFLPFPGNSDNGFGADRSIEQVAEDINNSRQMPWTRAGEAAVGAIETGVQGITGLGGTIARGLETGLRAPFQGMDKAIEEGHKTGKALTYEPRTNYGQLESKLAQEGFRHVIEGAGKVLEGSYLNPDNLDPTVLEGQAQRRTFGEGASDFMLNVLGAHQIGKAGAKPLSALEQEYIKRKVQEKTQPQATQPAAPSEPVIEYLPIEKVKGLGDYNQELAYAGLSDPNFGRRKTPIEGPPGPESFEFGGRDAVDFPLRQEVLQDPGVKLQIDNFRRRAERATPEELPAIQDAFAKYMRQFGIRNAEEAHGLNRPFYESSRTGLEETQLPIEKSGRPDLGVPTKVSDWGQHSPSSFELYSEPLQLAVERAINKTGDKFASGPGKGQVGAINLEALRDGFNALKIVSDRLKLTAFTEKDLNKLPSKVQQYVRDNTVDRRTTFEGDLREHNWATRGPMLRLVAEHKETGQPLGILELRRHGAYLEPEWVWTEESFRGGGIAKELYTFARELGNDIRASVTRSPAGAKMWDSFKDKETDPITGRPILSRSPNDPFVGPGKKQAGALKGGDPEYKAFKDSLPEPLKRNAKQMYKEYQKQLKEAQVSENPGLEAAKDIPGLDNVLEDYKDAQLPFDQVAEKFKASSDLPADNLPKYLTTQLGLHALSGPHFAGRVFNSPMIKWGGAKVRLTIQNIGRQVAEHLYNEETGLVPQWNKLSKEVRAEWGRLVIENEGIKNLTEDDLRAGGYSKEAAQFYQQVRTALDMMWDYGNAIRVAQGYKPLTKRPGYFPAKFVGDFYVTVSKPTDSGARNIVGFYASNSLKEVNGFRKLLMEKYPDGTYEISKVQEKSRGQGRDGTANTYSVYSDLMRAVEAGSPDAAALSRIIDEYQKNQVSRTAGFYQHMKNKKGIEGSTGRNEFRDAVRNADDMMRALQGYTHQLYEYGEFSKLAPDFNKLLDKNILPDKEVTQDYLRWYFDQARGAENMFTQLQNNLIDWMGHRLGMSGSDLRSLGAIGRQYVTWNLLSGWNFRFLTQQLVQPSQFLVQSLMSVAARSGKAINRGDVMESLFSGTTDFMRVVAKGKISRELQSAVEWGNKNHIYDQSLLYDLTNLLKDPGVNAFNLLTGNWIIRKTEQVGRLHVFITMNDLLKPHVTDATKRYQMAGDLTTSIMTDYRPFEMPAMYKKLGPVGTAMSALTRFKHNFISQFTSMTAEWIRDYGNARKLGPIMVLLGTNYLLSGLMGSMGREDLDLIFNILKRLDIVDSNPTEFILSHDFGKHSTYITHGLLSGLTGSDLSASLSPGSVFPHGTVVPLVEKAAKILESAWDLAQTRTKSKAIEFAKEAGPQSGAWQAGMEYLGKEGNVVMGKDNKGSVRRTPEGWVKRSLSFTDINESKERTALYEAKQNEAIRKDKIEHMYKRAYEDMRSGQNVMRTYRDDMIKLKVTPEEMAQALRNIDKGRKTTDKERFGGVPPRSLNQIRKYQDIQRYK